MTEKTEGQKFKSNLHKMESTPTEYAGLYGLALTSIYDNIAGRRKPNQDRIMLIFVSMLLKVHYPEVWEEVQELVRECVTGKPTNNGEMR